MLTLLFGVAVTLVLVLTPVFVVAHAWGWVLRSAGVLTRPVTPVGDAAVDGPSHGDLLVDLPRR